MNNLYIKNLSKLLALALVLFLGACSSAEESFLDEVKEKTVQTTVETGDGSFEKPLGTFSADGKTFDASTSEGPIMTFLSATDKNVAIYSATFETGAVEMSFTTTDGKTGAISTTVNGTSTGKPVAITLN